MSISSLLSMWELHGEVTVVEWIPKCPGDKEWKGGVATLLVWICFGYPTIFICVCYRGFQCPSAVAPDCRRTHLMITKGHSQQRKNSRPGVSFFVGIGESICWGLFCWCFCLKLFWDKVWLSIPGRFQTYHPLAPASWVLKMAGVSCHAQPIKQKRTCSSHIPELQRMTCHCSHRF